MATVILPRSWSSASPPEATPPPAPYGSARCLSPATLYPGGGPGPESNTGPGSRGLVEPGPRDPLGRLRFQNPDPTALEVPQNSLSLLLLLPRVSVPNPSLRAHHPGPELTCSRRHQTAPAQSHYRSQPAQPCPIRAPRWKVPRLALPFETFIG